MADDNQQQQADQQLRQRALDIANQRVGPEGSTKDVLAEAETVLQFLKGGGQVAVPGK